MRQDIVRVDFNRIIAWLREQKPFQRLGMKIKGAKESRFAIGRTRGYNMTVSISRVWKLEDKSQIDP
ncbi:MAG TPA: hypothetical protein DCE76_07625 [Anaerolineaceae bacterium]|nr:hypothetical protein [Anaerolineaceae bacterium]